jgi:hypothetical protein
MSVLYPFPYCQCGEYPFLEIDMFQTLGKFIFRVESSATCKKHRGVENIVGILHLYDISVASHLLSLTFGGMSCAPVL